MPTKSEGGMRTSSSRAAKRAPTWYMYLCICIGICICIPYVPSAPYPIKFLGTRLGYWNTVHKDFWGSHTGMSSGGSFQTSWWACFLGALIFHFHVLYSHNITIKISPYKIFADCWRSMHDMHDVTVQPRYFWLWTVCDKWSTTWFFFYLFFCICKDLSLIYISLLSTLVWIIN